MTDTATSNTFRIAHFAAKLACETDASDVHRAQHEGARFVLIDSRGDSAWAQGHISGAVHMPTAQIAARAVAEIPSDMPVVTYCWGPGCNGATRAALEFAKLGFEVREMIGGFEYWAREGFPVERDGGVLTTAPDALTAPVDGITCDC
ncbi:rhodanese-like domain-containing protein [Brevibacterium casei]|uniref:rhodanese-like domain-containing protein n=1 Tax=Brevibacterium casei TaxID=33889 RepID=UPI000E6487BA|nr:rhodanese-like domain-containing protein [Brevibacterium casei]